MVHVLAASIRGIDIPCFECIKRNIKHLISEEKYREIVSYNDYKDTCRSILGIALVKLFFGSYGYRIDKIIYTDGKPEVYGAGMEFGISHSENWVTCAFSKEKIGIDIEKKKYNERIMERCFNTTEIEYIKTSHNRETMINNYTKTWTIKESYIKYLGIGLKYGMKRFLINYDEGRIEDTTDPAFFFSEEFDSDYFLSICTKARECVEIVKVDVQSLLCI